MLPPDTNVFFSISKSRPDVWVFCLRANNFSGIKSELSIVSIVKLYKVTPVHLGYHFQYLQCVGTGGGTGGTCPPPNFFKGLKVPFFVMKSALFCDEKCPFL